MTNTGLVKMRALVWDGSRLDAHDDLELRPPRQGEVVVRVRAAGLCHSDLKPMDGDIEQPLPVILGHEACGVVVARGPGVDLPLGGKAVLSVLRSCGACAPCSAGRPTLCRSSAQGSGTPFSRAGRPVHQFVRLGAFAERTVVSARQVVPVPDDVPDPVAALLGCAVITAYGAVEERARIVPGETALVIGAGGIGLNVVRAARAAGASRVVVADINPAKRDLAKAMGATDFIVVPGPGSNAAAKRTGTVSDSGGAAAAGGTGAGSGPRELVAAVRDLLPGGADAVFECVGTAELLRAGVEALAWGGRAVIVGLPPAGTRMDLEIRALSQDKALLGCRMGSVDPHTAIPRLVERYRAGELGLEHLITEVAPLDEAPRLVEALRRGDLARAVFTIGTDS